MIHFRKPTRTAWCSSLPTMNTAASSSRRFRISAFRSIINARGYGTAPSEMLDIFGLSGSGRLLTIGLLPKFLVRDLLDALQQRIPLHKRGGGIVLTIPITGCSGRCSSS